MSASAIVLTKNSADKVERCFNSLKFSDELVVVDSGSTDGTIAIAKKYGAHIVQTASDNYALKRNLGAQHAKGEWLLYVDTDEMVPKNLAKEIVLRITNYELRITNYKIYRKNIILGKWLKHGGWWPDPVHRLMKKTALKRWEGDLHEHPVIDGNMGLIKEPLLHYSKRSVSEMVENSKIFSQIEATLLFKAHHPPVRIYHFIFAMWREFWNRGIVRLGWLDGSIGILEVIFQMYHQFMIYSILWQLQKEKSK